MKIKPLVYDKLQTGHTSFIVDFTLDNNITFIQGDSGVGKSAVFSFLKELSAEDKKIKCFNYLDKNKKFNSSIKQSKNKVFIIDNADLLLDDALRRHISADAENQYIIIGRNPSGLLLDLRELNELQSETLNGKTVFTLKKVFDI